MADRGSGIMVSEAVAEPHHRSFMIDSPESIVIDSSSEEDGDDGMTSTSDSARNSTCSTYSGGSSNTTCMYCPNCKNTFQDTTSLEAHLLDSSDCFLRVTEAHRVQSAENRWVCKMCQQDFPNMQKLKVHCFAQTTCKLNYIYRLTRDSEHSNKEKYAGTKKFTKKIKLRRMSSTSILPQTVISPDSCYSSTASPSPDTEVQESDSVGHINASRTVDTASLGHTVDQAEGGATENTDRVTDGTRIEHIAQYKRIGVRSDPASKDFSDTSQDWEPRSSKVPRLDGQNQTGSVKHKSAFMCQACQSKFDSHIDLKKHHIASARCKKILKETQEGLTCLQCGQVFANENVKFIHITTSPSCKDFLRKRFENGHFHEGTAFLHLCSLNPNMCCYCLITQYDIFNHILCSTSCRKKFERAVRQYSVNTSTEVSNLPTSLVTRKQSVSKQFACELCNKSYHTKRSLKRHISRAHEQRTDEGTPTQTGGHIRPCEHLFCFKCKRYLKSAKEVEEHPCEHTKLLSRCWREKAVWDNGAYECKHCQEKFFNTSTDLKYHMHKHDKGKSPLFKYISCGKRQTAATTASMATSENAQHVSSRPAFQCGRCNLEYYSGKDFKNHILHTKECLKFYQHPQDQCPVKNSGCFVCKRKS